MLPEHVQVVVALGTTGQAAHPVHTFWPLTRSRPSRMGGGQTDEEHHEEWDLSESSDVVFEAGDDYEPLVIDMEDFPPR